MESRVVLEKAHTKGKQPCRQGNTESNPLCGGERNRAFSSKKYGFHLIAQGAGWVILAAIDENSSKNKEVKVMKQVIFRFSRIMLVCFVSVLLLLPGLVMQAGAAEAVEQQGLVDKARITFESFMRDDNFTWLHDNLHEARGLLIVPSLLKGGFVLGASGGSGLLIVRDQKTGQWSQPGFYNIGSVTFGLQIGGEAAEVVMMVRTDRGVEKLLSSSFKLGGDTSLAVGPVGAGAKANVLVDILSFARSKGAYAGLSLEGAVVATRDEWNKAYYGKDVRPTDIFVKRSVSNPGSAQLRKSVAGAERGATGK